MPPQTSWPCLEPSSTSAAGRIICMRTACSLRQGAERLLPRASCDARLRPFPSLFSQMLARLKGERQQTLPHNQRHCRMDEVRPYLYGRSKGNPVGIRDSRHYCIGESLDARPLGHEPEKGSRKASAIPQARRPALHPKVRCILGKGGGRPEQLKQQALSAALLASGSPLFREEREGSMKHQPERGQRVLAFLLAGTLA